MKYSTRHPYSRKILDDVASFCLNWDQKQVKLSSRTEQILLHERNLYLQYMFINHAPSPLNPPKDLVARWLAPSKNFEIFNVRLEILGRLFDKTGNDVFKYPRNPIHFPNLKEALLWRRHRWQLYRQTRALFDRITTEDIIKADLASVPFYEAMNIYYQHKKGEAGVDYFVESHLEVANVLLQNLNPAQSLKILDIGCGDGRLLLHVREKFPAAKLFATNFFETTGVNPQLLKDPNFVLKVCTLEEIDFPENYFDAIISTEVIEHLRNPEDMALKMQKHLAAGGVFIATAPSVHTLHLSPNPLTYFAGLLSTIFEDFLPPFHNLYEPMTDLPLIHYAFSHQAFKRIFERYFGDVQVTTTRFTHLRKFGLYQLARRIPIVRKFGSLVMAAGKKQESPKAP